MSNANTEFKTIKEVADYLKANGWKVSQKTVYNHHKEGRIRPNKDGIFELKAVQKYASQLKRVETVQKLEETEKYSEKLNQEIENLRLRNEREALKLQRERQEVLTWEQMYLEFAGRFAVLETGFKGWIQMHAGVLAAMKDEAEIVRYTTDEFDQFLNEFATTKEFQVIILPE